jgi:hypothetical protein
MRETGSQIPEKIPIFGTLAHSCIPVAEAAVTPTRRIKSSSYPQTGGMCGKYCLRGAVGTAQVK